jgi:hypothetical protein
VNEAVGSYQCCALFSLHGIRAVVRQLALFLDVSVRVLRMGTTRAAGACEADAGGVMDEKLLRDLASRAGGDIGNILNKLEADTGAEVLRLAVEPEADFTSILDHARVVRRWVSIRLQKPEEKHEPFA